MIKLPAYFTRFGSKSDGSASLGFNTQELNASDFAILKENLNNFGYLLFKENQIQDEDIPTEDMEDKEKTPSKRLRAVLYILWQQSGKKSPFEMYYREQVEKVIEYIKNKLD